MDQPVSVAKFKGEAPLSEELLRKMMGEEGLSPCRWSNGPHDVYGAHSHPYHKVIYVVSGSIVFGLPRLDRKVSLQAGDRLDLAKGVLHDAVVGPSGVVCLEAHC